MTTTKMKYADYLPLIDLETGEKIVLWGGWYTKNDDGTLTIGKKICVEWTTFPF